MKNKSRQQKKIEAIIQVRMGSTRLPRKVLADIEGKPMIWHVVNRLKFSKKLDEIILAIPDSKENDVLEKFAKDNKIKYFRGSEKDCLSRYYETAKKFKCDVIVRITSDCPLIDPKIVDLAIKKHLNSGADYTSNIFKRTFPRGLDTEVFNFSTLEQVRKKSEKPYQREGVVVSEYIYENQGMFHLADIISENKENLSYMRWTVDEIKDLEFVREIYKRLYKKGKIFLMEDVITLLRLYSELMETNKDVKQKTR